jgi:hypothetical protein
MCFTFLNLDERTRSFMLAECEAYIASGTLYFSTDFSPAGKSSYEESLRAAIQRGSEQTLRDDLLRAGTYRETRTDKRGKVTHLNLADCARKTAYGEFYRFYLRGLCLRASEDGVPDLEIYRALTRV